jgi:hypothetical protein
MRVSNPDRSASLAHTDHARIVFDCRMTDDPAMMASNDSRSHDAVIHVYDDAGNVIETHEHKGDFKEW